MPAFTQYEDLLDHILANGDEKTDRTGTGTISTFGDSLHLDLTTGFPLVTTKKVPFKAVVAELLWFLSGSSKVQELRDLGANIWDSWEKPNGSIGPMYGAQWRSWIDADGLPQDQISDLIDGIREDPDSRRHIVSAWNVGELDEMVLAPCHAMFQVNIRKGHFLDLHLFQRSADYPIGVPFNIASYALLTHMLAAQTDHIPGKLHISYGDAHIYRNQVEGVETQLARTPYDKPMLVLDEGINSILDYTHDDIHLIGYDHHGTIKMPVAV